MTDYVNCNTREELEKQLKGWIDELVVSWYAGNGQLAEYLKADMRNYSFELKNAVQNKCLPSILAVRQ